MDRPSAVIGILILLCAVSDALQYTKTVQTSYGRVRGEEVDSDGFKFKAFRGIPYAKPPIGELRFKAPLPPENWDGVRDSSKFGHICPQPNVLSRLRLDFSFLLRNFFSNTQNLLQIVMRLFQGHEDCLSLNVYTTQFGEEGLKPVLVFIHGGAYIIGDGTDMMYGPDYLVQRDIVFVTINYRIGALGFLATNTSDASGNWGLKDQVAALRWIQDNIVNFGGDPKRVTIYGESAGSASVHLHLLSPLSKGLFQRGIMASGSATCPWAVTNHQEQMSRRTAEMLGAPPNDVQDPAKLVNYLRNVETRPLVDTVPDLLREHVEETVTPTYFPFAPVVEPPGTEGAFLTEHPNKLIAEGRFASVPLMIGFNDLEGGVMFMGLSKVRTPDELRRNNLDVCKLLPDDLKEGIMERNDCPKVSQQLLDVYFGGKPANSSPIDFIHMFGDLFLGHGVHQAQKWHAIYAKRESPAYYYYYTYDGEWNFLKDLIGLKVPGAMHGEEMDYIFKPKMLQVQALPPNSTGNYIQEKMLSFISNFVKHGNPTPNLSETTPISWEPASGYDLNTMHVGQNLKMEKDVQQTRFEFWDNLFKKYIGTSIYTDRLNTIDN